MAEQSGVPISPVGASKPELTLSAASINNEPVELDGTPTSPERVRRGSRADTLEHTSPEEQAKRAKLINERKTDPAVLVEPPQTPQAEELEKSGAAAETDGGATPTPKN